MSKVVVIGAGLAGISASFHIGHDKCQLFEKNGYPGGHIYTETVDGFTWDEGPHISFTKNEYVKELFASNVDEEFLEYPVATGNYFQGHWIPHPAQSNLFAVPEPLRNQCLQDFLKARELDDATLPSNYKEWLHAAFGKSFAETFPSAYTRKYWAIEPEQLSTDWVGERVYYPSIEDVTNGSKAPLPQETHYITSIRYPTRGGYYSYAKKMADGANIRLNTEISRVSFKERELSFSNGERASYEKLIITNPLPDLILKSDAPSEVKAAAEQLCCTSLLIVNVAANHVTARPENWIYVYDESKWSTRINCTEKLSPHNAPPGKTGIQVEVYFSKHRPLNSTHEAIASDVVEELIEMGLIASKEAVDSYHFRWVPWANVVFDMTRREAQNVILAWLEEYGLERESDDLEPMTDWDKQLPLATPSPKQSLFLAGRYAQWKYFWTDDCVLRGRQLARMIKT